MFGFTFASRVAAGPRRSSRARRSVSRIEPLETRQLMSVQLQLDYSLDYDGFMTAPRRALLQSTLQAITDRLDNTLAAVSSENLAFPNRAKKTFSVPADTLKVYVYGASLSGDTAGQGGGTQNTRRGQAANHYAPDAGYIEFDDDGSTNWYFGASKTGGVDYRGNTASLDGSNFDFVSCATHEFLHYLGIVSSGDPVFDSYVRGSYFTGPRAEQGNQGNPVPLATGKEAGHIARSLPSVMNPSTNYGVRPPMTQVEWGMLQDIGWSVGSPPGFYQQWDLFTHGSGGDVQVEIVPSRGVYVMQVDALAGDTLTLSTKDGKLSRQIGAATWLKLFDAEGNLLASTGSAASRSKASLIWHFDHGGTYFVGATPSAQHDYTMTSATSSKPSGPGFFLDARLGGPTSTEPSNIATATQPIAIGVGGYTDTTTLVDGLAHVYPINTVAGHVYQVTTSSPSGGGYSGPSIISIYDGSGHKIAGMSATAGAESSVGGNYGQVIFTAPSAGPYYVFVQDYPGSAQVSPNEGSLSLGWDVITSNGEFSGSGGRVSGNDYTLTIKDATLIEETTPPAFLGERRVVVFVGKRRRRRRRRRQVRYELIFNAALNASEAMNARHYHVSQLKGRRRHKRQVRVRVTAVFYNPTTHSVSLVLGRFKKNKPLHLTANGLIGANGTSLSPIVTSL